MSRARNGAASPVAPPARLDAHSVALNLARQAADKRRSRAEPLTRRAALAEAPWVPALASSGCGEREWRAAYADRLIERGLAEPSSHGQRSGTSGPSGRALHPEMRVRVPAADQERYRARAEREGQTLSEWVRGVLDRAAGG
jgi:hypothetical protein